MSPLNIESDIFICFDISLQLLHSVTIWNTKSVFLFEYSNNGLMVVLQHMSGIVYLISIFKRLRPTYMLELKAESLVISLSRSSQRCICPMEPQGSRISTQSWSSHSTHATQSNGGVCRGGMIQANSTDCTAPDPVTILRDSCLRAFDTFSDNFSRATDSPVNKCTMIVLTQIVQRRRDQRQQYSHSRSTWFSRS